MWPGSPQTALLFVGLPLVTILVLLATPLHDPGPPPRQDVAAAVADDLAPPAPRIARADTATAALSRAVVKRHRAEPDGVPAVIYEPRRTRHRPHAEPSRAIASTSAAAVVVGARASLPPQSP